MKEEICGRSPEQPPSIHPSVMSKAAAPSKKRKGPPASAAASAGSGNQESQALPEVWIVFQTVGYQPDGFHTSDVPESKIAGVFDTEATALTRAKAIVGEVYDRPWSEVKDDDDFEMKKTGRATVLEWSPPDSEFSLVRVEPHRVKDAGGEKREREEQAKKRREEGEARRREEDEDGARYGGVF